MKILHTGDIHLGTRFLEVSDPGRFRQQLRDTFARIIDLAQEEKVALFLIAGDLFDSSQPAKDLVYFVSCQLQRLQIPVCLIPGTHDKFLFQKEDAFKTISRLTILDSPRWLWKEFPELDCTVYGINPEKQYPLADLRPQTKTRYQIALVHAAFAIPDKIKDDHLVRKEDIANCGMNYVALGHWHGTADYSQGKAAAWYPGTPEPLALDEKNTGNVIIVDLEKQEITKKKVGRISCLQEVIDVSGFTDITELKTRLLEGAGPEVRKLVRLRGVTSLLVDDLGDDLEGEFGQLKIVNDSQLPSAKTDPEAYRHQPLIKRFLQLLEEEIANSQGVSREIAIKAREYGLLVLQGQDIL